MDFSLSFAFCFKAPTTSVVMIAGTAGGAAVEAVNAGAGAADCTAAAEVVGVWLF